ncbi:hypothetical protein VIGAN_11101700 [Vigna angularis var. angularis]|uniref:Glucose-methanol-choline oxidoreductase C-terminal domain-containing protein n=1 Tax=Vigna angularis var. angularis TaxID=157739 RepID=A0A0S3T931_PHAAN|nr:hypothetical protein VIGAN_11101700 [Vigna angularis var. angularis]
MFGVKDKSKIVLVEDPISQDKRLLERRKNAKMEKAAKSISEISLEVDRLAGMVIMLTILGADGAQEIGTHHNKGRTLNVKQVSYHEFEKFVKEESSRPLADLSTPFCSAHQMGSCRMGSNPKQSVVNETGETWEMEGLYVADTSVFPTALGVNPMVIVQAIAYNVPQSVLEVLRMKRSK